MSGGEMYPEICSLLGQGQELWIVMIVQCQWHNKALWIWNTGGNQSTWRKTCPISTFSTTNLTLNGRGWNPGLQADRPPPNRLSRDIACSFSTPPTIMCNRLICIKLPLEKIISFWIFDQRHRSMKCSTISNHICQCNWICGLFTVPFTWGWLK